MADEQTHERPALPEPPYYAVIFTSVRSGDDGEGYSETATRMETAAASMPGYLGFDSVSGRDGLSITVSYWRSEEDIARWRAHPEHAAAIAAGKGTWYAWYESITAKVERAVTHRLPRHP